MRAVPGIREIEGGAAGVVRVTFLCEEANGALILPLADAVTRTHESATVIG